MNDPSEPPRAAAVSAAGPRAPALARRRAAPGSRVLLLAGLLALVPRVAAGDEELRAAPAVADEVGRAALQAAADQRQQAYALGGEAREAALIAAAGSFGAVADDSTASTAVRAEGAFRAGELLRARKLSTEAAGRFRQALQIGAALAPPTAATGAEGPSAGGPSAGTALDARSFAARGLLELAHLERRADRLDEALGLYGRVLAEFPDQPQQGSHAATWRTRLLVRGGRLDEAVAAVDAFGTHFADRPLELVRNAAVVAEALTDAERGEQARTLLEGVEEALRLGIGAEDTGALDALRAVRVTVLDGGS